MKAEEDEKKQLKRRRIRRLTFQDVRYVVSATEYFEKMKVSEENVNRNGVNKRTAECLGLSERTIGKALQLHRMGQTEEILPSAEDQETRERDSIIPDDVRARIRGHIRDLYCKKLVPTLNTLMETLKSEVVPVDQNNWIWSRATLGRILHRMGYKWKARKDYYAGVMEKSSVIASRVTYLRKVKEYRESGKEIFYQDETWTTSHMTVENCWQADFESGLPPLTSTGVGLRLIVSHVCGPTRGLLPGAALIYRGRAETRNNFDYHTDMNQEVFNDWMRKKVLPNIKGCVIALDRASYHRVLTEDSRPAKSSLRKDELQEWLRKKKILFPQNATKAELYLLCRKNTPKERFIIEDIAKEFDVEVLWFPVAHPLLNPIEHVWARIKSGIRIRNQTMSIKDVEGLTKEELGFVTKEDIEAIMKKKVLPEEEKFREFDEDQVVSETDSDSTSSD